jgi:hypothetical protein
MKGKLQMSPKTKRKKILASKKQHQGRRCSCFHLPSFARIRPCGVAEQYDHTLDAQINTLSAAMKTAVKKTTT